MVIRVHPLVCRVKVIPQIENLCQRFLFLEVSTVSNAFKTYPSCIQEEVFSRQEGFQIPILHSYKIINSNSEPSSENAQS